MSVGTAPLAFAAAHLLAEPTGVAGLLVFALVLSVGMLLAWLLERPATLVAPIVTHAVFNLTLLVLVAGGSGLFALRVISVTGDRGWGLRAGTWRQLATGNRESLPERRRRQA